MKIIEDFITEVTNIHKTGIATEHSYRSAIEALFQDLSTDIRALNEPKRVACGAPDFIINRDELAIGHVEAKDINVGLRGMKDANKNQQERYRKALPNLIYTNCLDWDFYRNGDLVASVTVADYLMGIQPNPNQYERLETFLREFIAHRPQSITSPRVLATKMAGKAQLIKDVLHKALKADENLQTELSEQYHAFKEHLIHDITPEDFADIYAETIAYGMFAARLHDTNLETFSRQEALALLPKSNPFLRNLFTYLAGYDLDERIAWIIDDLASVFQAADVAKIMEGFGKLTGRNDPFLHFYETFLAAYNPTKRKARGVWYTPEPVVNFIVRAVDKVLQTEFGIQEGLADSSKIKIDWDTGQTDKKGKITTKKEVHRVQILDPATGTGTFLAEVIKQIAPRVKNVGSGMWSPYVENELIRRLHGFELLMASYAMCHMKLDMILTELGYKPSGAPPRLSVYLTNSLEEGNPANQALPFAQWLSNEVKQANTIKHDMPIMCVVGNPPYLGEGGKSEGWLGGLMDDYKKEPGGKEKLKEKNPKWLNDLYVKFIRMSSHLIEKNGEGVLGFVTNHGYLDNPTFRGMRWHLLKTFDKIWILDLHGNAKKKEVTPEGKPDKNVFDIQQGVSIIVAVKKKGDANGLASVMHGDLWGDRATKYAVLSKEEIDGPIFAPLEYKAPRFALVRTDHSRLDIYSNGILLCDLMPLHGNGIVTKRDPLNIQHTPEGVTQVVQDFLGLSEQELRQKYRLPKDVRDWRYEWAKKDIKDHVSDVPIQEIGYRLFDRRFIFYSGRARGLVGWPVAQVMRHYIRGENIGLVTSKAHRDADFAHVFVTDKPTEAIYFSATTGSNAMNFPLYLYPEENGLDQTRLINFEPNLHRRLKEIATHPTRGEPNEVEIFDYIYGVLHCPNYRKIYAPFLKSDFPRIPWPVTPDEFWDISSQGTTLRKLHLMDSSTVGPTSFPIMGEGTSIVEKHRFENGKIWINSTQYFDNVSQVAWDLYIGGYQPARKWLKDRKGSALTFNDVQHYQRILKILLETDRLMGKMAMTMVSIAA
ncbi:MAG: type ISP restriction/modification enzyme [Herminiimonas sp.]|uniref:type ISP restriction/modification enzyme n=1 Tax=Herminiimonas sp. TaxID=1926289 RepID=UPI002722A6EC|nr:type ISP restriction/modification enzyme [Herminiimonas sp.]MDO9422169.1 type ISP restriction/modification enzyme [Herminiimonas sp.]